MKTFKQHLLQEKSLSQVKIDDVIRQQFNGFSDKTNLNVEVGHFIWEYPEFKSKINPNKSDLSDDEISKLPKFKDYIRDKIKRDWIPVYDELKNTIVNGYVTMYRKMVVKQDWLKHIEKQGKHLGIYWAWEKRGAKSYWGKHKQGGDHEVTMIIKVKDNHINWFETILLNMDESLGDEHEIRLFKGTPIIIEAIIRDGEELDISTIKDKKFKA